MKVAYKIDLHSTISFFLLLPRLSAKMTWSIIFFRTVHLHELIIIQRLPWGTHILKLHLRSVIRRTFNKRSHGRIKTSLKQAHFKHTGVYRLHWRWDWDHRTARCTLSFTHRWHAAICQFLTKRCFNCSPASVRLFCWLHELVCCTPSPSQRRQNRSHVGRIETQSVEARRPRPHTHYQHRNHPAYLCGTRPGCMAW